MAAHAEIPGPSGDPVPGPQKFPTGKRQEPRVDHCRHGLYTTGSGHEDLFQEIPALFFVEQAVEMVELS